MSDQLVPRPEDVLQMLLRTLDARLIRRGDDVTGIPYLWRGYLGDRFGRDLVSTKKALGIEVSPGAGVSAFLHKFVSSDELEYHCHPWAWSYSFILSGSYAEDRVLPLKVDFENGIATLDGLTRRQRGFNPGDVNLILGESFHRVDLLSPEVWTLFVHGARVHDWGFVPMGRWAEPLPMRLVKGHTRDRLPSEVVR